MKSTLLIFGILLINFLSFGQGPLTGKLVINKGDIAANWNEKLIFEFYLKNAGDKAINITDVIGSCECQSTDKGNIQTIEAGKSGIIKVTVTISKDQLSNQVTNGVVEYDKSVIVVTNGKKPKYQLYTRATIRIKN
jgi:hypothetical protein